MTENQAKTETNEKTIPITWKPIDNGHGVCGFDGVVGGLIFFKTWHVSGLYYLSCALPDYRSKKLRKGSQKEIQELAAKILQAWMAKAGMGPV